MDAIHLRPTSYFDPERLSVLRNVFDQLWIESSMRIAPDKALAARASLALALLTEGRQGLDPVRLRSSGLKALAESISQDRASLPEPNRRSSSISGAP